MKNVIRETYIKINRKKHIQTTREHWNTGTKDGVRQSKQTDLGIPQRGVLSVTLILVAINGILAELDRQKS